MATYGDKLDYSKIGSFFGPLIEICVRKPEDELRSTMADIIERMPTDFVDSVIITEFSRLRKSIKAAYDIDSGEIDAAQVRMALGQATRNLRDQHPAKDRMASGDLTMGLMCMISFQAAFALKEQVPKKGRKLGG